MIVAPTMDVVRRGIFTWYVAKLGNGSDGVSTRRKLNGSLALPTTTTRVVGTPQKVFANLIMTTNVNRIVDQPPMNSMTVEGYRNANVMNPKGGYREPSTIITPIPDRRNGHYIWPNKVALKYPDFKKGCWSICSCQGVQFCSKKNAKTFEEYITNAFSYMLRDTTSN